MLNLQLLLGNALQAVYLLESEVELEGTEIDALRTAAQVVGTVDSFRDVVVHRYAMPPTARQLLVATGGLSGAHDTTDLSVHLRELASALTQIADGKAPDLGSREVIDRLKFLHDFAHASTSRQLDEVH